MIDIYSIGYRSAGTIDIYSIGYRSAGTIDIYSIGTGRQVRLIYTV